MGYHFIPTGPAKSRELDNARQAGTKDVGTLITASGKVDWKAILERKWLQLAKLNIQFCIYALLIPLLGKYAKLSYKSVRGQVPGCSPKNHFWSGKSKATWVSNTED